MEIHQVPGKCDSEWDSRFDSLRQCDKIWAVFSDVHLIENMNLHWPLNKQHWTRGGDVSPISFSHPHLDFFGLNHNLTKMGAYIFQIGGWTTIKWRLEWSSNSSGVPDHTEGGDFLLMAFDQYFGWLYNENKFKSKGELHYINFVCVRFFKVSPGIAICYLCPLLLCWECETSL